MGEVADFEWATRPLRHLTGSELMGALQERQNALVSATSRMAAEQIQLGIERLEVEIRERARRAGS